MTEKDSEQDRRIAENNLRITRNEEAIKRQTQALEQIRDHYYPPQEGLWKRTGEFLVKVLCVVLAYAGGVQAVDWYLNVRASEDLAEKYATVARKLFFEQGNAAGGVAFLEKAIALDEGEVAYRTDLSFLKGMAFSARLVQAERPLTVEEQGRVDALLAEATFFRESEPNDPLPNILQAQAHFLRGEKQAAAEAVMRAVALAPERAPVRVSACAILAMTGHADKAREQLAEAERLDATLPLGILWKGMLAMGRGERAEARRHFEDLTNRVPRLAVGHVMLARTFLMGGKADLPSARTAFARALAMEPNSVLALRGMAEVCAHEGNPIVARLWLDRALTIDENDVAARLARARLDDQLGEYEAACADLTKALDITPFKAEIYLLRAESYAKMHDAAQAEKDRKTAAALSSGTRK